MRLLNPNFQPVTLEEELGRFAALESGENEIMWHILCDGECIGAVWINEIDRDALSGHYGIMIGQKDLWGKGIATVVKRAVTGWALGEGGFNKLLVEIFPGNEASRRTSEKVGYELHPATIAWDGKEYAGLKGEMTRERWEELG
jgi:RimJ/RimL family protein N-acetyltransferase